MKPSGLTVSVFAGLLLALACVARCHALESPSNPQTGPGRNGRLQKRPAGPKIDPSCGTVNDMAARVAICAKPLMDLLQGSVEKWPRTEDDAMKLCDSYVWSERCIRDQSRKCARGIQKTIITTLANSVARARKRECGRSKAAGIIKTTMCLERQQKLIHDWMGNVTNRLDIVEHQMSETDARINGLCCMVAQIEQEITQILTPFCEEETKLIVRLYRWVLEDVNEFICRNPKCNNFLKGYKVPKETHFSEIIAVLLRIIFSLENI